MKVYISGPMTGLPEFNYPAFRAAAIQLVSEGHVPLSPAANFNGDTTRPYADYLRLDIAMLLEADAIRLLPGWHTSRGALLEVTIAGAIGLPII